jgi:hypothetical protein
MGGNGEPLNAGGRSLFLMNFTKTLIDAWHHYGMVFKDKDIGVWHTHPQKVPL